MIRMPNILFMMKLMGAIISLYVFLNHVYENRLHTVEVTILEVVDVSDEWAKFKVFTDKGIFQANPFIAMMPRPDLSLHWFKQVKVLRSSQCFKLLVIQNYVRDFDRINCGKS